MCCRASYEELGELGQGRYGVVMHVRCKLDRTESAVKTTAEGQRLSDAELRGCLLEAQIMGRVSRACPAALQLHATWVEAMKFKGEVLQRVFMRTELCGESLGAMATRWFAFDERTLQLILTQVRSRLTWACCACHQASNQA